MPELRSHPSSPGLIGIALIGLACWLPRAAAVETLSFRAAEGQRIVRRYRCEATGKLDKVEVSFGAETRTEEDPGISFSTTTTIDATDEVEEVAGGLPTKFVRTFDALDRRDAQAMRTPDGEKREEVEEHTPLAGRAVRFEWSAKDEQFVKRFVDAQESATAEADELEGLVEDMDLREFLPPDARAEAPSRDAEPVAIELPKIGTQWTVPVAALKIGALRPAGRIRFEAEGAKRSKAEQGLVEAIWDALDGRCRASLTEVREDGGAKFAVIAIEAELDSHAEVVPDGGATTEHPEIEVVYRGTFEGTLEWDLGAARARSLSAEWKTERAVTETRPGKTKRGEPVTLKRALYFGDTSRCRYDIAAS